MSICTVSDFCEAAGLPHSAVAEALKVFQRRELVELARCRARMQRRQGRVLRALPIRDENGEEIGVHEARIDKSFFWNVKNRKTFGWEGLTSDDGMRDILKDNPQFRVETVSGKIVSGYTPPPLKLRRAGGLGGSGRVAKRY